MGIALVPLLPVKLSSSRVLPQITVSYNLRNASGVVLESEVTSKLEAVLARIQGVKNISSVSSSGSGYISLEFDKSVDMDIARFEVSTAVRQVWPQLPEGFLIRPFRRAAPNQRLGPHAVYRLYDQCPGTALQDPAVRRGKPSAGVGAHRGDQPGGYFRRYAHGVDPGIRLGTARALGITTSDITGAVNEYVQTNYLGMAIRSTCRATWH